MRETPLNHEGTKSTKPFLVQWSDDANSPPKKNKRNAEPAVMPEPEDHIFVCFVPSW
jgi:hypothetical protein